MTPDLTLRAQPPFRLLAARNNPLHAQLPDLLFQAAQNNLKSYPKFRHKRLSPFGPCMPWQYDVHIFLPFARNFPFNANFLTVGDFLAPFITHKSKKRHKAKTGFTPSPFI